MVFFLVMGGGSRPAPANDSPAPVATPTQTPLVVAWLQDHHQFLQRYLAVLWRAEHDYRFDYVVPPLLIPATIDIFSGSIVPINELERQYLYPPVGRRMPADQQHNLAMIDHAIEREYTRFERLQQTVSDVERGAAPTQLGEPFGVLAGAIRRQLVFEEEQLVPLLAQVPPSEQTHMLRQLQVGQRQLFGPQGQQPYEQLLTALEDALKALGNGRVW